MSNEQVFEREGAGTASCPVCGVPTWTDALGCPACGTALRAEDADSLFTTVAVDNAEVVADDPAPTRDQLWATAPESPAPLGALGDGEAVEGELLDGPADGRLDDELLGDGATGDGATGGGPTDGDGLWDVDLGPGFSAEPVVRHDEVVDAEELWDVDPVPAAPPAPSADPPGPGDRPLFAAPAPSASPVPTASGARAGGPADDLWDEGPAPAPDIPAPPAPADGSDPHGMGAVLARLEGGAVDRAAVPLAVCAVLLDADEVVEAAVVGEMLGHPAAIVVTARRVLVANGRRWRPVVDVFPVARGLEVRGRHDGGVAAVTLLDHDRLVTVDAVTDVPAALQLAALVRSRSGA